MINVAAASPTGDRIYSRIRQTYYSVYKQVIYSYTCTGIIIQQLNGWHVVIPCMFSDEGSCLGCARSEYTALVISTVNCVSVTHGTSRSTHNR